MQAANTKKASKVIEWEYRLARFLGNGQSVNEFCRAEGVSPANFYRWRKLLGDSTGPQIRESDFIEVGTLPLRRDAKPMPQGDAEQVGGTGALLIRLDLGQGLVLQIERR